MSRPVKKIGVVADDVTGSNDIGIMFGKSGLKVNIFNYAAVNEAFVPADVVIVDTDSRFDRQDEAYRKVYAATHFLKQRGIEQFYNKTCSVFRGNIGAEFDAMLDALDEEFAVVVLGFPKNGRVTRDGIHYVHGKLLEESEFRNDPMNPMTKSNLVEILQEQTKRRVESLSFRVLDRESTFLRDIIESKRKECNYLILDVRNQEDLKIIAEAIHDLKVICGASAIAEEVATYSETTFDNNLNLNIPGRLKGILAIAGSLMPQTKTQIERARENGVALEVMDTTKLLDGITREQELEMIAARVVRMINEGRDIIIHAANEECMVELTKKMGERLGLSEAEVSKKVSKSLAALAQRVIIATGQHRVLVAGGDTSASFCETMEVKGMQVFKEIQSGLPSCISLQEEPLFLILKSGSFGNSEFFIDAMEHLRSNI